MLNSVLKSICINNYLGQDGALMDTWDALHDKYGGSSDERQRAWPSRIYRLEGGVIGDLRRATRLDAHTSN